MAAGRKIGCFGLTEPDFGSDPAGMRTRATRSGGDWIINGTKMWITNGSVADIAIVWARTDEGIRGFAVPTDTPGFTAHTIAAKMSLRASVTSELVLDDVRVPDSARLPGATSLRAPLSCLNEARFGIVFGSIGAARDCLETALTYAQTRNQFDRPIGGFQLTQQKLADMTLERARASCWRCISAGPRTPTDCCPSRSASESSTTSGKPSPLRARRAQSLAPAASPASTRSCGTRTTWSPC